MANLKDIRIRINSVKSTRQVTSAMKMVSAAKFKKAQDDVEHIRPFVGKLKEVVAFLGRSIDDAATSVRGFAADPKGKILIVSIASNKGLAGAFNANISKRTEMLLRHDLRHEVERGEVELLTIGKQVTKALGKVAPSVAKSNCDDLHDNLTTENVRAVAQRLSDAFFEGKYRSICVIYNEFVNAAVQNVKVEQLLPLSLDSDESGGDSFIDFIVEPNKKEALDALVPEVITAGFHKIILESAASEHGARMTSMHKATDNATELLGELQLQYNKARQTSITNELIEIVSGAEALNN